MDCVELFLNQHAIVHSARVSGNAQWSMEDSVLEGLTEEQMRLRPGEWSNSIGWLMWHMSRIEDVTINLLLAGRPQVLVEGGWMGRLGLAHADVGTGMRDEEVAEFSARVDVAAVREYRMAVGRRTREVVPGLDPASLSRQVDPARIERLTTEGVLGAGARGLAAFWGSRNGAFILSMPATGHQFSHWGEAISIRRRLGI
jgi:DinB superfamily